MRAAVYSRISRDSEEDGKGVERQEQDCLKLIERKGWTLAEVYRDNDIGAAGKAKHRPRYEAMIQAVRNGEIDVLVAYSNSRLSRRPAQWVELINLAQTGKVEIATVASGRHDLTTADGRATALTIAVWDAAEAERTAERVKRNKEQRAADGKPQGGRYRVFGYTREFKVIDTEAAIVREVFSRRAKGESTKAIATDLAARAVKGASGSIVKPSTIDHMLRKPGYAGRREYNGKIIGDTNYDAIIDYPTYLIVAENMQQSSVGLNARKHLLSGFLYCSKCLSGMTGKNATAKRKACYKCAEAYGGCGNVSIQMRAVDEVLFMAAWRKQLAMPARATETARDWPVEIEAINSLIKKTQASYTSGELDPEDAMPVLKDLRIKKMALEKEQAAETTVDLGPFQSVFDYETMNLSQRRLYIGRYIDNVIVGPWDRSKPNEYMTRLKVRYQDGTLETLSREGIQVTHTEIPLSTFKAIKAHPIPR